MLSNLRHLGRRTRQLSPSINEFLRSYTSVVPQSFVDDFKKVAPNLDLPKTPAEFLKERPPVPAAIPEKLTVNFVLPHEIQFQAKQVRVVVYFLPIRVFFFFFFLKHFKGFLS